VSSFPYAVQWFCFLHTQRHTTSHNPSTTRNAHNYKEVESGSNTAEDGSTNTYEEGWLAVPLNIDQDTPYNSILNDASPAVRLLPAPNSSPADRQCIVLTVSPIASNDSTRPRGTIIRIGDWCQGILRRSVDGTEFAAARWLRVNDKWEKLVEIGCEQESMQEMVNWLGRFEGQRLDASAPAKGTGSEREEFTWLGVGWRVKETSTW
jgi:hypothetical protein